LSFRKSQIAVAALVACGALPLAHAAPSISWATPANGAVLHGNASACAVNASSDATRVAFYLDNVLLSTDTMLSDGVHCAIDTTKFSNGAHELKATAFDASGNWRNDVISVKVQNAASAVAATPAATTTPTAAPTPAATPAPTVAPAPASSVTPARGAAASINPADIIGQAQANVPFSQQSGFNAQVLGQFPAAQNIPEAGINGPKLPNGETLRLGKAGDPFNTSRNAFLFQVAPTDPLTSGSHRSELEFPMNIEPGKTYWIAYSIYVYDWGTLMKGDDALFGTQLHSGNSNLGLSPAFTIYTSGATGGRTFQIYRQHSTSPSPTQSNSVVYRSQEFPLQFGQWMDFVFKFRESIDKSGLLQVWMNGNQIMDYTGPLGYSTPGFKDYAKFGYYNWSSFDSSRKVLVRSPVVVNDPTGSKYQASDLRAFVQANQ